MPMAGRRSPVRNVKLGKVLGAGVIWHGRGAGEMESELVVCYQSWHSSPGVGRRQQRSSVQNVPPLTAAVAAVANSLDAAPAAPYRKSAVECHPTIAFTARSPDPGNK